jgi:hypothetical protein
MFPPQLMLWLNPLAFLSPSLASGVREGVTRTAEVLASAGRPVGRSADMPNAHSTCSIQAKCAICQASNRYQPQYGRTRYYCQLR